MVKTGSGKSNVANAGTWLIAITAAGSSATAPKTQRESDIITLWDELASEHVTWARLEGLEAADVLESIGCFAYPGPTWDDALRELASTARDCRVFLRTHEGTGTLETGHRTRVALKVAEKHGFDDWRRLRPKKPPNHL
jgi:hypothetical protein